MTYVCMKCELSGLYKLDNEGSAPKERKTALRLEEKLVTFTGYYPHRTCFHSIDEILNDVINFKPQFQPCKAEVIWLMNYRKWAVMENEIGLISFHKQKDIQKEFVSSIDISIDLSIDISIDNQEWFDI